MRRALVLTAALVVMTAVSGCLIVERLTGPSAVVATLEVFNRTEADIFYLATDGERLEVPSCGSAMDTSFRIDRVEVRTADGYIRAFGVGAAEFAGRHLVLVEVSSAMDSGIPEPVPVPDPLPPCEGEPEVQVGF